MKPRFSIALITSAAAIALTAPGATGAADGQIGVNAAIRNSVETKTATEASLHPAVVRAPVHIGDAVVSGANSALQVLLLDRSVFTLGSNARMTIDRFVYDPNRGASDVATSVARGSFRFMSGRSLAGQGRSVVTTPVASIGVRGTIVEGVVGPDVLNVLSKQPGVPAFSGDPAGATLVILSGPGQGSEGFDKPGAVDITSGGTTVALDHPGQAALIWPGQAPFIFWLSGDAAGRLTVLLIGGPSGPGAPDMGIGPTSIASGDILNQGLPDPSTDPTPPELPSDPQIFFRGC